MILAAGLTPAWQQILVFDRLATGHVNRARSTLWCGSGKVLNVGAALHHLGAKSSTLGAIGGVTGDQIRADFAWRGISARWIATKTPTRVCTTLLDSATGTTTELVENSAPLSDDELAAFVHAFAEESQAADIVVLSGSLPNGTSVNLYRQLLESTSACAILDVRGRELIECLPLKPFLVKPNREELAATVGRTLETETLVVEAMTELRRAGVEWVIVSHGAEPLLALGPNGLHRIEPPSVQVVIPIGCGDSLTAAIAAQLQAGREALDAIHFGVTYAARKASSLFPVLE